VTQCVTVTQKPSIFHIGTHLPLVHSQLTKQVRLLLEKPEPEDRICSKRRGILGQVQDCAYHIHTACG